MESVFETIKTSRQAPNLVDSAQSVHTSSENVTSLLEISINKVESLLFAISDREMYTLIIFSFLYGEVPYFFGVWFISYWNYFSHLGSALLCNIKRKDNAHFCPISWCPNHYCWQPYCHDRRQKWRLPWDTTRRLRRFTSVAETPSIAPTRTALALK